MPSSSLLGPVGDIFPFIFVGILVFVGILNCLLAHAFSLFTVSDIFVFVFLGIIVGFIVFAIILPMLQISSFA